MVAVFGYDAQLANDVELTTCTDSLDPGVRSTAVHWSTSLCGLPAIVQLAGPDAIDQSSPGPPGSASWITTPCAVPVPTAALLVAVTMKPICEPASTVNASAVSVSVNDGGANRPTTTGS